MRLLLSSVAAASLLAASTAAAATAPAIHANTRVASPVQAAEGASDSTWMWVLGGAVVALIFFLIVLDDDDEDDLPISP